MRINLIKQFNLKSNLTCNIYTEACNMLLIYTTAFSHLSHFSYSYAQGVFQVTGMIKEFFWVWNFQYWDFSGSLILVGTLRGIQNNLKIRNSSRVSQLCSSSGNFYGWGIFQGGGGGIVWSRDFFVWSPRDFGWFLYLPPFDLPCHLKSGVPPWAGMIACCWISLQHRHKSGGRWGGEKQSL